MNIRVFLALVVFLNAFRFLRKCSVFLYRQESRCEQSDFYFDFLAFPTVCHVALRVLYLARVREK